MTAQVFIFTHNRPDTLRALVSEFRQGWPTAHITIIDDGSDVQQPELADTYIRFNQAGGKPLFFDRWNHALRAARNRPKSDIYLFTQDDIKQFDFAALRGLAEACIPQLEGAFLFNTINDGRKSCWGSKPMKEVNNHVLRSYFTDCHFFCSYCTLSELGWQLEPIPASRFRRANVSSGVGEQLTKRLNELKIPIYHPVKSLCYHGNHPSIMHPKERLRHPLISK